MQNDWLVDDEGQLSIDVMRQDNMLVIRAFVAGVNPQDLNITVNGDLLTIRGERKIQDEERIDDWLYKECYWGRFSRSIVLPYHVASEQTKATINNGILEIKIPITNGDHQIKVNWE